MKTDDLIAALAVDTVPGPAPATLVLRMLPLAMLASLAGLILTLGLRQDLSVAMTTPVPLMRHVLTLALFSLALRGAFVLARPEGRAQIWLLALPAVAAAMLLVWALMSTPQDGWQMALEGKTQMVCLIAVPLLSVLPVAAIMMALRQGASARPGLSGALAGLAGGGLGAAIYALHCTEDSPLFYVTWYGVAILIVTAVSALIGQRILRW